MDMMKSMVKYQVARERGDDVVNATRERAKLAKVDENTAGDEVTESSMDMIKELSGYRDNST